MPESLHVRHVLYVVFRCSPDRTLHCITILTTQHIPPKKNKKKTTKKRSIPRVQALGQGLCLLPWIAAGIAFAFLGFDDVLQFFGIDDHWLNTPVYVCVLYGQATPLPYRFLVTSGTLIVPPRNGGRGNVSSRTPVEVALCCSFYADCAIPMTSCNRKDLLRQYSGC